MAKMLTTFRLSLATKQQLVDLSRFLGVSQARVVEVAVGQLFKKEKKP